MHKVFAVIGLFLVAATTCAAETGAGRGNGAEGMPSAMPLLPGEREATGNSSSAADRRCMKVCKEWGESCITDRNSGERKCRRTCERFGVECF